MAQHDYVIANGTGAAVRSDLNNALAAIVSQNSGATAPATTYAYQFWADTTTGLLKLRNSANSAWITLFQLDGEWSTLPVENGTAAAPSIYFKDSGTDTGFFSGGTDQVNIATAGTERVEWGTSEVVFNDAGNNYDFRVEGDTNANLLFVDASADAVGIGTSSPGYPLTVNGRISYSGAIGEGAETTLSSFSSTLIVGESATWQNLALRTNGITRLYVNSSGNVGIGTTPGTTLDVNGVITARSSGTVRGYLGDVDADGLMQVRGESQIKFKIGNDEAARIDANRRLLVGTSSALTGANSQFSKVVALGNSANNGAGYFSIGAGSTRSNGEDVANLWFTDNGAGEYASIRAFADGATGSNDYPGRLVFSTTADGASSPTERMRIHSDGSVTMGTADLSGILSGGFALYSNASSDNHLRVDNTNSSFNNGTIYISTVNASTGTSFDYMGLYKGTDKDFGLGGDGTGRCDGSWTGGGADYAEYFEWSDSNPDEEDRRGISVVLDGEKIREAVAGEDPIGVISGNPSVVGDAAWNKWSGKFLRDDYGSYIYDEQDAVCDDGSTIKKQVKILNPAYDPNVEYIPREQRPEWDCVGLMGKLRIRKGQVTGSRWIKMRDISDSVEEWLVR